METIKLPPRVLRDQINALTVAQLTKMLAIFYHTSRIAVIAQRFACICGACRALLSLFCAPHPYPWTLLVNVLWAYSGWSSNISWLHIFGLAWPCIFHVVDPWPSVLSCQLQELYFLDFSLLPKPTFTLKSFLLP